MANEFRPQVGIGSSGTDFLEMQRGGWIETARFRRTWTSNVTRYIDRRNSVTHSGRILIYQSQKP